MARPMDEATRRAQRLLKSWRHIPDSQEEPGAAHCEHCVSVVATLIRQTEARVRRETLAVVREPYSNRVGAMNGDSPLVVCRKLMRALAPRRRTTTTWSR